MPGLTTQRRLAASELKIGESRVWINPDPEVASELSDAITREDIRSQIRGTEISRPSPKRATAGAELGPEQQSAPMVTAKERDTEEAPKVPGPREKSSG